MNPDILKRLREDHRKVLARLEELDRSLEDPAAPRTERIGELAALLRDQFGSHIPAEDEILFPAIARHLADGGALLADLREEHGELRSMLAALEGTLHASAPERDEQALIQARDLRDLLRIHIRREETLVFAIAERLLPDFPPRTERKAS